METKKISELHKNPKNPRSITKQEFDALQVSIKEFGDLGGIVFNKQLNHLVGGHMRTEAFLKLDRDNDIMITQRFEPALRSGTTAIGYVKYEGEFFAYREVDWSKARDTAANIAPNRIGGTWDLDLLNEANQYLYETDQDLLAKTGQTPAEIARLMGDGPADDNNNDDGRQSLSCKLSDDQYAVVERSIQTMKSQRSFADEPNPDFDGNAIFYICNEWLSTHA